MSKWQLVIDGALADLAVEYTKHVEVSPTQDVCKCEWLIHPDDTDKPVGQRRKRLGGVSMDCPVHTREGFILGFFAWLTERANTKPTAEPEHDHSLAHIYNVETDEILECPSRCPVWKHRNGD